MNESSLRDELKDSPLSTQSLYEFSNSERFDENRKFRTPKFFRFPWLSVLASVALLGYFVCLANPELISPYYLMIEFKDKWFQILISIVWMAIIIRDVLSFRKSRQRFLEYIELKEQEISALWESRKKVQQKAHVYSSHADKLKFFISDKLLEYIEYDEKFLHFKSIAAEVRHNGVIAFDKVRTTLSATKAQLIEELAMRVEDSNDGLADETSDNDFSEAASNNGGDVSVDESAPTLQSTQLKQIEQALSSMRYLWDLLDLSTADNLALHIANHLITCEEQYCQQQMQKNHSSATIFQPTFKPRTAIINYLTDFLADKYDSESATLAQVFQKQLESEVSSFEQFRIDLGETHEVLGNSNHLILILENLLKNALYFHDQRKPKLNSDKIAVQLSQQPGVVTLAVYNRGPLVSASDQEQIFQLGFSTRKASEHHGKGLGLFFIQEIVKGYEGRVRCDNIENAAQTLTLRWETDNDVVITKIIKIVSEQGGLFVEEVSESRASHRSTEKLEWDHAVSIVKLEVSSSLAEGTLTFAELDQSKETVILDQFQPLMPAWQIKVTNKGKRHSVTFLPLDRRGVCFTVMLPDVIARVDDENPLLEHDFDRQVELLAEQFKDFE